MNEWTPMKFYHICPGEYAVNAFILLDIIYMTFTQARNIKIFVSYQIN